MSTCSFSGYQRGGVLSIVLVLVVLVQLVLIAYLLLGGDGKVKREAQIQILSAAGDAAVRAMEKRRPPPSGEQTHGSAVDLIYNPIELKSISDSIHYATGVAKTVVINTPEGNVVFDTGLSIQAAKMIKTLRPVMKDAPVTHVVVSHSHADHAGGVNLWREKGTEVITHREFPEEQRYLAELEPYFYSRNRTLFPWIPEKSPDLGILNYGNVDPTILVDEGADYRFTLGDMEFMVISTPGAEGADNICLWLPKEKILFTGDFFGPQFPQFPNVFTMRGEKIRKPVEYIRSLNKIIALEPEMIVPAHYAPVDDKAEIMANLVRTRDAVQHVHDSVVAGMNAGKSLWQLMREIKLPEELDLVQNHGKVDWAVRSIWEYYSTWFHFESTTELYAYPAREVYPYVADAAGIEVLLAGATEYLENGNPVHALHLVEMGLAGDPAHTHALELQLKILKDLKGKASSGVSNDYEIFWLDNQIVNTEELLGRPTGSVGGYDAVEIPGSAKEVQ